MKLPSTAIFREGVKGKQGPFGLQFCASHGRTFAWHFRCGPIDGENAPHSPFASGSVCDVRDLRHGSRAYFEIKQTKFGLIGMHFFLRRHIYFHGSDILLDLKVMLCTSLS